MVSGRITREDKTNRGAIASVFSGAIMLKMTVFGQGVKSPAYGQGGMVKFDDDIVLVTAKHHQPRRSDDKASFTQVVAEFKGPQTIGNITYDQTYLTNLKEIKFDTMDAVKCSSGLRGEYSRRYGIDVSLAQFEILPSDTPPWKSNTFHVFELVPNDFHYEATVENSKAYKMNTSENSLHALYGYAENYNVYSGEILHVGDNHFEHNINCFQGCSGAILFLLEGNHAGKAIAVHVGSPDLQEANLAFKIHKGLKLE